MLLKDQRSWSVDAESSGDEATIVQADGGEICRSGRKLLGLRRPAYPMRNRSSVRVQVRAVNRLSSTPIPRVAANPLTSPVPRKNKAAQLINVVR